MKKSDVIKVLMGIGITKGNAEKIAADVPDTSAIVIEDKDLNALIADHRKTQSELFENDSDFISKIQKREYSKNKDIFIRKLKQNFDLTAEEIKAATKQKNDGNEVIDIVDTDALIELAAKKATANKDKNADALQQELLAANKKIKDLEEIEIPKIKNEGAEKEKKAAIKKAVEKMVSAHGEKLRVKIEAAMPAIFEKLNRYELDLDDKNELVIKKGGLAVKNKDATGLLTAKDIIDGGLDELEFIKKSNADDPAPPAPPVRKPGKEGEAVNPHLAKAQANLEGLKKIPVVKHE